MSPSNETKELATLLRQLARWVEEHPGVFEKDSTSVSIPFEPFRILSEEGEDSLRGRLEKLSVAQLRHLIQTQRLDPAGRTKKWDDRHQLANFAFDRLRTVWAHGRVFEKESGSSASH